MSRHNQVFLFFMKTEKPEEKKKPSMRIPPSIKPAWVYPGKNTHTAIATADTPKPDNKCKKMRKNCDKSGS